MTNIEEAKKLIVPGCICEVTLGNVLLLTTALKEAIEQHESFRQEVSDAVEKWDSNWNYRNAPFRDELLRFIISKPDPIEEAAEEALSQPDKPFLESLRAALAKRGLEIREKSNG